MTAPALRPYQVDAIQRAREAIGRGRRHVLIVAPTGSGKTIVASSIIASAVARGRRVLVVAHRRELIRQTYAKVVRGGVQHDAVGVVMASVGRPTLRLIEPDPATLTDAALWAEHARSRPSAPVQVASIDTLRRRALPPADLIIIDEAHRALAPSYRALRDHYTAATHLGLTATPCRTDGRGLGDYYDELVTVATVRQLIDQGHLVEPRVWSTAALPDLSSVRTRGGDYDAEQLAAACDRRELVGDIVEHWQRLGGGARTVVFAASVQHSQHIAETFRAAGVAAEHLDGETPTPDRDAILARLDRGETTVVSNYGVLVEGWDQPSVAVCILARPTKSEAVYLQAAGRVLRPAPGKAHAIILDHAGCALQHGLPQDDREHTLEGRAKRTASLPSVSQCPSCLAVLPRGTRVCEGCHAELPASGASPREEPESIAGELVQLEASVGADARHVLAVLMEWRKRWERGKPTKPGWCAYRYSDRTGGRRWPRSVPLPTLTEAQRQLVAELDERRAIQAERGYSPAWVHAGRGGAA